MPGTPPEGHLKGMVCARCDVWVQHRFVTSLQDIPHVLVGDEYATLADFTIELFCPVCGTHSETTARNLVIDTAAQVIIRCEVDLPPGDMTPPDYPPQE